MKEAFIKLHISIVLAGFTGLFGKLITLNEGVLVWYRMGLAALMLALILGLTKRLHRVSAIDALKIGGVGLLLGLHWVLFYGSIKASNVSIGVICFSLVGCFTAFFEPLIFRRRISGREVLFSLITIAGIALIFGFDKQFRTGIYLGILSSALAALFTITNKRISAGHSSYTLLLYEMIGGFVGLSCLLPGYFLFFPADTLLPDGLNLFYLLLLALVCTIGLYLLQIQVLKKVSAFTVNLSYNLEPVYSILLAMLFFHEARLLNLSFYLGLLLIVLSVGLQSLTAYREMARRK